MKSFLLSILILTASAFGQTVSISDTTTSATGGTADFKVTLSKAATTPVVISYATVAGTASSGAGDYIGVPTGTLTIPKGTLTGDIEIVVKPHPATGIARNYAVHISKATGATIADATGVGTIQFSVFPPAIGSPATTPSGEVTIIKPTDNFVAILNAATVGHCNFKLISGATYIPPPQQADPKVTGWSLDATGATIKWTLPGNVATACFKVDHKGTVIGGTWTTNSGLFEVLAPATINGLKTTDGAVQSVKVDTQFGFSGAGTTIENCDFGWTYSVNVFVTQSCTVKHNAIHYSVGEVALRVSPDGAGVSPDKFIADGNEIWSVGGGNLKGCCELRQLGAFCQFINNVCHDYVRGGQGSAVTATQYGDHVLISGNRWDWMPPTSIKLHLLLMAGFTAEVTDNDFLVDAVMQVSSVSAPSQVVFTGNRRHLNAPNIVARPQLWNPVNNRAGGVPVDGGNNVVIAYGH